MDAFPRGTSGVLPYASKESPLGSTWILDVCLADYYYIIVIMTTLPRGNSAAAFLLLPALCCAGLRFSRRSLINSTIFSSRFFFSRSLSSFKILPSLEVCRLTLLAVSALRTSHPSSTPSLILSAVHPTRGLFCPLSIQTHLSPGRGKTTTVDQARQHIPIKCQAITTVNPRKFHAESTMISFLPLHRLSLKLTLHSPLEGVVFHSLATRILSRTELHHYL